MRQVLKAGIQVNLRRLSSLLNNLIMRQLQSFMRQPTAGRCVKRLFKIFLERRKASAGQIAEPFKWQVKPEVLFHKSYKVKLPGYFKMAQQAVRPRIYGS